MKLRQDLGFACSCGEVRGHVKKGTALLNFQCHCNSCAAAERHFGQPDPGDRGVGLVWIAPDRMVFDTGRAHLKPIRMTKGPVLRWYAECCGVPMMNFATKPRIFIIGLLTARVTDTTALGPVKAHSFVKKPNGKLGHDKGHYMITRALGNTLAAAIGRRWAGHPLLENGQTPIRAPELLNDADRAAAGL